MAARSHPPSLPGALPACVSSAPSLLTARSPAMAARPALPSPPRAIPLPVGRPRAVHDRTAHGEAGAQTRQWPVKGHGGGRPARGHGGGRRAPHRNPAARQRRAPPPRAVNETSSSEYLRFGSPAAGSALNLGGSTPSLAGSASAHSPFLQPPPSRTPAYGCGRGRCQARRLRPPATALTRAGCGLRRPSCPAAGASQEWPRGCCLTRSAPSLADPPAIARAGLIPGFLLSALFDVVVFFLSGLSAVRHCCPPRTPESQVETNGQVVPGPEYESPNLNGSIGTSSPQEHLTGILLLPPAQHCSNELPFLHFRPPKQIWEVVLPCCSRHLQRCMEQYAEIFSQVVTVQKIKARKKRLPFYCI
ncbi:uncharacterized protein LOC120712218 isoform X5 [Panicum virgatum]|uniref:uncharacterized protein LOC120712218 isoform X5 n=1 Tax=Panicum virgatum TaxID=38727 RepID=UPI0019D5F8A5|nr:uncharacterized protein LOC120712218 isoform X5 [Panicum virgatum]